MPRTTLDFHEDRSDAIAALVSLREVGLKAEDVASIWEKPADAEELATLEEASIDLVEAEVRGANTLQLSGWLTLAASKLLNAGREGDLSSLFAATAIDTALAGRARATLAAGGGVIAVRARDAHLTSDSNT